MTQRNTIPNPTESRAGLAPAVAWEPCPEFVADETDPGVCADCGWLEDDHTLEVPRAA